MHNLEDNASLAAVFLKPAKINGNYGAKLYSVICQIGHSIGANKLANADILFF